MSPTTVAAATGCLPMLQSSEPQEVVVGSGRRRLSLDTWVCLPILRPVRTSSSTSSSQVSSSGSSCTTHKDSTSKDSSSSSSSQQQQPKTLTLDVPSDDLDTGCETPKSKEHRIPDVDITFCPPAPRKPRASTRRRRVQPTSFVNTPQDLKNFILQYKVQVIS